MPADVTALAEGSARRAGLPLGAWLTQTIEQQLEAERERPADAEPTPIEELMAHIQGALTNAAPTEDAATLPDSALIYRFIDAPPPPPQEIPVAALGFGRFQRDTGLAQGLRTAAANDPGDAAALMPVIARASQDGDGAYEIVTGLVRWRRAAAAGNESLTAQVMTLSDHEVIKLTLIEMLMTGRLSPVATAESCHWLRNRGGLSDDDLMEVTGLGRAQIHRRIALLSLPGPVLERIDAGILDGDVADALIDAAFAEPLSRMIIDFRLPARRVGKLVTLTNSFGCDGAFDIVAAEKELGRLFGCAVTVARGLDDRAVTVTMDRNDGTAVNYRLQASDEKESRSD